MSQTSFEEAKQQVAEKTKVSELEIGDRLVIDDLEYVFKKWVRKRLRRIGMTDFREFICVSDKKKKQLMSCNLDHIPLVETSDGKYIYSPGY